MCSIDILYWMKGQIKISEGKEMLWKMCVNIENHPGEECIISDAGLGYPSV